MIDPTRGAVPPVGGTHVGMVGWEDDGGVSADLASGSNDGSNLVRVQLFEGRTPDSELNQSQAQGYKLLCRLADHCPLPAKGTLVHVSVPHRFGLIPGAACIIATLSSNPVAQANATQGEQVFQIPGSSVQMYLRKDMWGLRYRDANNPNTPDSFVKFDADGLQVVFPFGTLIIDAQGARIRTAAGPYLQLSGLGGLPSPLSALGSYAKLSGAIVKVDGTKVCLGPDTPATQFVPVATGLAVDAGDTSYQAPLATFISALMTWVGALNSALGAPGLTECNAVATAMVTPTATLSTAASTCTTATATELTSASVSASIP